MANEALPKSAAVAKFPAQFLFPPVQSGKAGAAAAGLFVIWAAVALDTDTSATPDAFKLGFCANDGTLFDVAAVSNPWPLAISGAKGLGSKLGAKPEQWSPQKYDVVLVAHPSPDVARQLLARFQANTGPDGAALKKSLRDDWHVQTLTPTLKKGNLVVDIAADPKLFVPGGPAEYGGFLLYRLMPYQTQPAVQTEVKKLVFHLSRLRYPAACFSVLPPQRHQPYVSSETEHGGAFDVAVQACLHRYQNDLAGGTAFQLTAAGIAQRDGSDPDRASWAYLMGAPATQPAITTDPGVADAPTAQALQNWFAAGLRKPGAVAVLFNNLWARSELWTSFVALDAICKEFGAVYRLKPGSSFRVLPVAGKGQIDQSFHKIGAAVDLEAALGDPSDGMPVGIEGDWVKKNQLDWLIYIHSSEPAQATQSVPVTDQPVTDTTAFLTGKLGTPLPSDSQAFLKTLQARIDALKAVPTSQIKSDLFRDTISRFQWQSGQSDGGDAQTAVTATKDAQRNALGRGAQGWLNVSRHAFFVGLFRIGAHEDKFVTTDLATSRVITPNQRNRTLKAMALDDLAEGIRLAADAGKSIVATQGGAKPVTVPAKRFSLTAVGSWLARASDNPDVLAPPPPNVSVANTGVDVTIQVPLRPDPLFDRFMNQRSAVPVVVISVGDAFPAAIRSAVAAANVLGDVQQGLAGATALPGKTDQTVVVRPSFARELDSVADPGTLSYEVPILSDPKQLEWWHLELQPDRKGVFWSDMAQDFGLDQAVLEAPPPTATSTGPIFVGGGNLKRPNNPLFVGRKEPQNQVTSLERPNS